MNIDPNTHPLFDSLELFIPTPMIQETREIIQNWIWADQTGGVVLGDNRVGKSWLIDFLLRSLEARAGPKIVCGSLSMFGLDQDSVASLNKNFCFENKIKLKARAHGFDLVNPVLSCIHDQVVEAGAKKYVLFVDEFQLLSKVQLQGLASIHNHFMKEGVRFIVILVGNYIEGMDLIGSILPAKTPLPIDEKGKRKRKPKTKKRNRSRHNAISARFLKNICVHHGIRSQKELRVCLAYFDQARFPEKTGPTYTNFFLGHCAPDGWRLESLSSLFWHVYQEEFAKPLKISSFGMEYFIASVRTLLSVYLNQHWSEHPDSLADSIRKSISGSCLVPSLVSVQNE